MRKYELLDGHEYLDSGLWVLYTHMRELCHKMDKSVPGNWTTIWDNTTSKLRPEGGLYGLQLCIKETIIK